MCALTVIKIASEFRDVERNPAERLRRVEMEYRSTAPDRPADSRDLLDRSDFCVRKADSDQSNVIVERCADLFRRNPSVAIRR